jgi:hypothetical protein
VKDWRAWRAGVRELVAEADAAARQLAGERVRQHRRRAGLCVGCGVELERRSPGCHNCSTRHSARRRAAGVELDTLGRRLGTSASSRALTEQAEAQRGGVSAGGGALAEPLSSSPA